MEKQQTKILLVDDEPDIIEIIKFNLEIKGYQIYTASDGLEAIQIAEKIVPHLIIMDVMMPNMDGIEACEQLRKDIKFSSTIIMFLSARGEDFSYVAAFEAGADDYVTKPIKPKVLVSKVKALLRRFRGENQKENILDFGGLIINKDEYKIIIQENEIFLPRKEFELIYLLASKINKVCKREEIMETIWGSDVIVGDRTIDVHIRKLREKIGNNYLKTVKGIGYKFTLPKNNQFWNYLSLIKSPFIYQLL